MFWSCSLAPAIAGRCNDTKMTAELRYCFIEPSAMMNDQLPMY